MPSSEIIEGDCRTVLAGMAERSVQCVVTSPPYWGLRDYGVDSQLGLEATPAEFIETMVGVFREVKRVLRDDGTLWLNMGDKSTTGDPKRMRGNLPQKNLYGMPWRLALALQADGAASPATMRVVECVRSALLADFSCWEAVPDKTRGVIEELDREWADAHRGGWYLRSDIIWAKPNPMPESCTDRPTKAHEYLFLLTKRPTYYWDAEAVREKQSELTVAMYGHREGGKQLRCQPGGKDPYDKGEAMKRVLPQNVQPDGRRNIRTVWNIPTQAYPDAHFATFPEQLVEPCVKAGTSERGCCPACGAGWVRVVEKDRYETRPGLTNKYEGENSHRRNDEGREKRVCTETTTTGWRPGCGCQQDIDEAMDPVGAMAEAMREPVPYWSFPCTVLDPFCGSGTVGVVCAKLNRAFIGIELNPEYKAMAEKRIGDAMRVADDNRRQGEFDYD